MQGHSLQVSRKSWLGCKQRKLPQLNDFCRTTLVAPDLTVFGGYAANFAQSGSGKRSNRSKNHSARKQIISSKAKICN